MWEGGDLSFVLLVMARLFSPYRHFELASKLQNTSFFCDQPTKFENVRRTANRRTSLVVIDSVDWMGRLRAREEQNRMRTPRPWRGFQFRTVDAKGKRAQRRVASSDIWQQQEAGSWGEESAQLQASRESNKQTTLVPAIYSSFIKGSIVKKTTGSDHDVHDSYR